MVLVDSPSLVYLVEGEPSSKRRRAVELFLAEAEARGWRILASTLIWAELLEKPLADGDEELASRYRRFLSSRSLELRIVDVAVAESAAALSASLAPALRRALSSTDIFHIATALCLGASAILGNDEAWRGVPSCPPLVLVDELAFELD